MDILSVGQDRVPALDQTRLGVTRHQSRGRAVKALAGARRTDGLDELADDI